LISEGICGAAVVAGAGEDAAAGAEEAATRAALAPAAEAGALVTGAVARAPRESAAGAPKVGAVLAADAAAEDWGAPKLPNAKPARDGTQGMGTEPVRSMGLKTLTPSLRYQLW
jgi:hypothetical protein